MKILPKIDIHVHTTPEALLFRPDGSTYATPRELRAMYDAIGVERALLLPSVHEISNREARNLVRDNPDVFGWWFCNFSPSTNCNDPEEDLSRILLSYKKAGDFAFLDEESDDDFNPDTGEAMLGDIIISVEKVQEQAKAYGHSEKREFAFLIVHSMLHLFGYDHMTPEDAAIMEPKQREILEAMNISREE